MKNIFTFCFLASLALNVHAQTFADLVASVDSSVVTIHVLEQKNMGVGDPFVFTDSEGLGSGVLVGKNGSYILTAAHVVANASKIEVVFKDGTAVGAVNRRVDRMADVALIELNRPITHLPAAKIGDSESTRIGEDVFIIGAPLGLSHSVSRGIISGKHTEKNLTNSNKAMEFFQTDAAINQGNSGGPMFNMDGEVIGIVSSILSFSGGFEGLGFAATSSIAKDILGQQSSIWFGTDVIPMSGEMCRLFNVPQEGALLVQSVTDGSPAHFMGVKGGYIYMTIGESEFLAGGDFILEFDGIPLNSMENLEKLWGYLNKVEKGHQYVVKVFRAGEIKELRWRLK